jgi:hypothetical protein
MRLARDADLLVHQSSINRTISVMPSRRDAVGNPIRRARTPGQNCCCINRFPQATLRQRRCLASAQPAGGVVNQALTDPR